MYINSNPEQLRLGHFRVHLLTIYANKYRKLPLLAKKKRERKYYTNKCNVNAKYDDGINLALPLKELCFGRKGKKGQDS